MIKNLRGNKFFFISLGAIPGAILRFHLVDTFLVNIIGCFLLGFFNNLSIKSRYKLMLTFGLCGSLTTFSGWIFDLYRLLIGGFIVQFLLTLLFTILISFISVYFGHSLASKLG